MIWDTPRYRSLSVTAVEFLETRDLESNHFEIDGLRLMDDLSHLFEVEPMYLHACLDYKMSYGLWCRQELSECQAERK